MVLDDCCGRVWCLMIVKPCCPVLVFIPRRLDAQQLNIIRYCSNVNGDGVDGN